MSSNKIRLYIDGVEVELESDPSVVLSYDASTTRSIDAARKSSYLEFDIESSNLPLAIFGGEGYLNSAPRFNSEVHTALLSCEGVTLCDGEITLREISRVGDTLVYRVRITREAAEWAEMAADTLISDSVIEYSVTLRPNDIIARWEEGDPVQFFPVVRDDYTSTMSSVSLETVRRIRSVDDYHPFLHINSMLNSIAEVGGYEIDSTLFSSEEADRLYMSGSYASQQNDVAKEAMDFMITKLSDESSTADYMGRVSIAGSQTSNAIMTIVDIESLDEDSQCYTRSSCVTYVDGAVQFTPTTEISVGFEYRLHYTSEYYILSRDRLTGFDTLFLGESPTISVELANNFIDERENTILSGLNYLVVVFDYEEGESLRLRARLNGSSVYTTLVSWSDRTTDITMPTATSIEDPVLQYSSGVIYPGDWALYQGYVTERGETEIDLTVRTSPRTLSPTSPKRFEAMYIQGAETGMKFSLLADTTITPYFASYPGYGDVVDYHDLSQHELYQSDVVESLQHLFNLRYYTDNFARRLYIDPLESFYRRTYIWNWSDRIVADEGFSFCDCGVDVSRERLWGYQDGDGAISRSSPDFGEWSYTLENYASTDRSESLLNPVFSPSLNDDDGVLLVGDRDDATIVGSLEFSPRVVYYMGLDDEGTPRVVFHSAEEGVSLCFEDRDGLTGLNQYYTSQIEREERSQYVTLCIALEPFEVAYLFSPMDGRASVLSTFKLYLDGEWCEARIESVEEYRVADGVARIKFLMI